jgi:hypothetical protein
VDSVLDPATSQNMWQRRESNPEPLGLELWPLGNRGGQTLLTITSMSLVVGKVDKT